RDVFRTRNNNIVLRNRHGDAGDVDFLKSVGAEKFAADLTRDADHRRRIEHGRCNSRDHVCCAGAGSSHGHTDAAAGTRVTISHVRCALFMTNKHVMQLRLSQSIVYRKDCPTRITENIFDAEMLQRLAKYLCTSELHSVLPEEPAGTPPAGIAVTAPCAAEETSKAYFAITPCVNRGAGGVQLERRRSISSLLSSALIWR